MKTTFAFRLPHGHVDEAGVVHRDGMMRLAVARDEIQLLQDPRVQADPTRLMVLLIARVVTKLGLGDVQQVSAELIANLHPVDLTYLLELYRELNEAPTAFAHDLACPSCQHCMRVDVVTGAPTPSRDSAAPRVDLRPGPQPAPRPPRRKPSHHDLPQQDNRARGEPHRAAS
jgi:hypothetical protein